MACEGVSSRCARCCLQHGVAIAPSTYYDARAGTSSAQDRRDEQLKGADRTGPPGQLRRLWRRYTSIAFTERLAQAGIDPSVGSVGDVYDNALAESVIRLFNTELISPGGPWRATVQGRGSDLALRPLVQPPPAA